MRNRIFDKRIPTILGIILILLGIPLTTFVIKSQTILNSNASNSQEPQNVKLTNITDTSFTLTYLTPDPVTGSISYGNNKKLGKSELEDVDREKGDFSPKKIHSISVKKLTPATKYYFTIISGAGTFLNNKAPFETTTGPDISSASAMQSTVKGRVVLPDGNAPSEALVYLNAENSQVLSSTTAKDGKFSFSLEELRTDDLSSYFDINDDTIFEISATDGSLKSTVLASLNKIDSIPTITLSNNYDFTQKTSSLIASESAELSSGYPSITSPEENLKPQILTPKENQSFTDQKPQFRGKSLPNEKVEIIIHSDEEIITQVTADGSGNWTYRPPENLSPGNHTITIKSRDSSGILTTVAQSFTVFAQETTPAAPSVTLTVIPTPTSLLLPTATEILITSVPTFPPVSEPSPTQSIIESKGGLPPTGNTPTYLIVGGIVTAISGTLLFLLTRTIL